MKLLSFCSVILTLCVSASAWDSPGHEQVADMAYSMLSDAAKSQVYEILSAGDPTVAPTHQTVEGIRSSFRHAATFPDSIKSHLDTTYEAEVLSLNQKWQPHLDPHSQNHEDFRCRTWHYYDTPIRFTGPQPVVRDSNALVALTFAQEQLKTLQRSTGVIDRRMQFWWLCWIEHLTGDLHQPLHCTEDFKYEPTGDDGGNGFEITQHKADGTPIPMRLHMYWDSGIGHAKTAEKLRTADAGPDFNRVETVSRRWLADGAFTPSISEQSNLDVASWIAQGARVAETAVYADIIPDAIPTAEYNDQQEITCKTQAILAAYRLAGVLEQILGGH